jgi:hypothetical protein
MQLLARTNSLVVCFVGDFDFTNIGYPRVVHCAAAWHRVIVVAKLVLKYLDRVRNR